ncbi:MAG: hypothetical protein H7039_14425 [Bryobacteraceae bacterium]|nr:hypothetical protein [Bryobacteraceae bacterium]
MRGVSISFALLWLSLVFAAGMCAQSISVPAGGKGPQARTGEELDAFGLLYEAKTIRETALAAESFLRAYPKSEFVEYAAATAMHSYHELGDWSSSKRQAETVLRANAENVDALLHLARLLIDPRHEEATALAEARSLADRGLARLKSINIPRSAGSREWVRTRRSFTAVGAAVLGWICFREGNLDKALEHLKEAALSDAQGEYFYRLAVVAAANRDWPGSRDWSSRAIKAGPEWISALARQHMAQLESDRNEQE